MKNKMIKYLDFVFTGIDKDGHERGPGFDHGADYGVRRRHELCSSYWHYLRTDRRIDQPEYGADRIYRVFCCHCLFHSFCIGIWIPVWTFDEPGKGLRDDDCHLCGLCHDLCNVYCVAVYSFG